MTKSLGIIYDRVRWEEKALIDEAQSLGVEAKFIDAKQMILDSSATPEDVQRQVGDVVLQRCISHIRGLHVAAYLEMKGVKVVNSYAVSEACGNKLRTTMTLEKSGIPTPRSILTFSPESAVEGVEILGYPVVFKPVIGSWGRLVVALRDRETARAFIDARNHMDGPYSQIYYVQEMVKRPPRDIRCIAVGGRIVVAMYRYAPPGEWRTNVAVGGRSEVCPLTSDLEQVALKASEIVGGGILGIDIMESPRGLLVNEVNPTVEFRGASTVSKESIPRAMIEYVLGEA